MKNYLEFSVWNFLKKKVQKFSSRKQKSLKAHPSINKYFKNNQWEIFFMACLIWTAFWVPHSRLLSSFSWQTPETIIMESYDDENIKKTFSFLLGDLREKFYYISVNLASLSLFFRLHSHEREWNVKLTPLDVNNEFA